MCIFLYSVSVYTPFVTFKSKVNFATVAYIEQLPVLK